MNARTITTLAAPLLALSIAACGPGFDEAGGDEGGISSLGETGGDEQGEPETGGDDDDSAGESDETGGEPSCANAEFRLESVTPNVMLVLDKSGSMNSNSWDDDNDSATPEVTRWHSLHGVVADMSAKYEQDMNFGLTLFPALDAEYDSGDFERSCAVSETPEVAVAAGNSAALLAAIPGAEDEDFGGATPATEGILTALAHLEGLNDEAPDAMVLITDGAANCASADDFLSEYDSALEDAVRDAWEGAGVPTYVVGIDISEDGGYVDVNPREALDQLADAGGVASEGEVGFYDATDPAALEGALDEITQRLGCKVELDFGPEGGLEFIVEVNDVAIPQVDSCSDTSEAAWVQIDPVNQPNHIELCNAACEDAEVFGGTATMCPLIP